MLGDDLIGVPATGLLTYHELLASIPIFTVYGRCVLSILYRLSIMNSSVLSFKCF